LDQSRVYLQLGRVLRHRFRPALLGAVALWDFFIRVMQGVTTAFFRGCLVAQPVECLCLADTDSGNWETW